MAHAVIFSTSEEVPRPAITPWQKAAVEETWKMVEDQMGLLSVGIEIFKK